MKKLYIAAAILFIGLVSLGYAAIPAPAVNQNLGIPDTNMVNQSVALCKGCHPGAPDIHHYMVSGGPGSGMVKTTTLGCMDCHPIVGGQLTISLNCHDCHDGKAWSVNPKINMTVIRGSPGRPHHNTTKNSASNAAIKAAYVAANRTCVTCHGDGYLDNYNDGHYVPSYNASMITPMASYKVNDSGKLWGGCLACHDDGSETINGIVTPIYNSDTTHHTARFWIGYQCNNCHVSSGFRAEPNPDYNPELSGAALRVWYNQSYPSYQSMFGWDITTRHFELRNNSILLAGDTVNGTGCEKCHSVRDLHNIETASPGLTLAQTLAAELPGYGHIGNSSDCNGCHQGWAGSTENPFPGPKAMEIESVTPGVLTANVATVVTIAGSNFVEAPYTASLLVDGTAVPATVTETSITASVNLAAGAHSIVVQKDVATTAPTTVMAVAPGTVATATLTGTTLTVNGAGLGAGQTMVSILKADGTRRASDSISVTTNTQIVAVASQAVVGDTVEVITSTGKATKVITADTVLDSVTVSYPNAAGVTWKRGTAKTVTWNKAGSHQAANVKIELMKGTAVSKVLASSTPNDGSQSFTIPSSSTVATNYKIRVTSLSHTPTYVDSSDNNFAVTK
jgi:hypothetical protein